MSLKIGRTPDMEQLSEETRNQIFTRLKPENIEQFYLAYQLWSQQQQIRRLQLQILALHQKINENEIYMEQFQMSAIALATLAQLQAYGVEDIDLLDRMLERGDEWLDHSLQLLERCEQLDLIGGDYTQWCEHAMEGAYEWMNSIADPATSETETESQETELASTRHDNTREAENEVTEAQLLQKLMHEETEEIPQIVPLQQKPRTTQPLTINDEQENTENDTKKREIIGPTKRPLITQPLTTLDGQSSTYEAASITSDRSNELLPLEKAVTTPEQINQYQDDKSAIQISHDKKQLKGQLKDLQLPKKGQLKKKRGFFRWLLAKIMRK